MAFALPLLQRPPSTAQRPEFYPWSPHWDDRALLTTIRRIVKSGEGKTAADCLMTYLHRQVWSSEFPSSNGRGLGGNFSAVHSLTLAMKGRDIENDWLHRSDSQALRLYHEYREQSFQVWDDLVPALDVARELARLKDGLTLAFGTFLNYYSRFFYDAYSVHWHGPQTRIDFIILLHDECLLAICKEAAKRNRLDLLRRWHTYLLQPHMPQSTSIGMHRLTAEQFLPRAMQYMREADVRAAMNAKTLKTAGQHLPMDLVAIIRDQALQDHDIPTTHIEQVWSPLSDAFITAVRHFGMDAISDCCNAAVRRDQFGRAQGSRVFWSRAERRYVWYHCCPLPDNRRGNPRYQWVRCGAQPAPPLKWFWQRGGKRAKYLYSFADAMWLEFDKW